MATLEQINDTEKLIREQETTLHPDLKIYLSKDKLFGALQHPLVYDTLYMGDDYGNQRLNLFYKDIKAQADRFLKEKKYGSYIFRHERPWRFRIFSTVHQKLNNEDYWGVLFQLWIDSENIWQELDLWIELLKSDRAGKKKYFMDEDDKEKYKALPKKLTVYRGHRKHNKDGLSWTLSKEKARWFADKRGQTKDEETNGRVSQKIINKSEIFAYTDRREEKEIILLP